MPFALLELVDHLLGGACDEARPRFSQGTGLTPELADAARRFTSISELGYAAESLRTSDAADYWVQTLWLYLQEPLRLNVLDPLVYRLYHSALMDDSFWAGQHPDWS